MPYDAGLIQQLRDALREASADAKAAGEELDRVGTAYVAAGADSAARSTLKPSVDQALKKYENLSLRAMRLRSILNQLEG
jgi:hypothetical protein